MCEPSIAQKGEPSAKARAGGKLTTAGMQKPHNAYDDDFEDTRDRPVQGVGREVTDQPQTHLQSSGLRHAGPVPNAAHPKHPYRTMPPRRTPEQAECRSYRKIG